MAISTSFGQFSQRMAIQAKVVTGNAEKAIRRAAVAADTALVMSTPVDTGRAKGNWTVAIGSIDETVLQEGFPSGEEAISRGRTVAEGWKLGSGTIFLANSLPYILPLENGYSAKAPSGMTQFGIAAAVHQIQNSSLLR